ncbi:RiPP maturation radical SAM C-methyltransferase [Saccharopolyspora shandongensis]|uniref:RiPP maturation radical SAM C-methyltransferase n=1 Tax=Saccharopolyspora shandongensis TaxID=418495 RepID=UPI003426B845
MDVTLVNMPWASVGYPSLACGILKTAVERGGAHRVRVVDANLDFFDWMHQNLGTRLREYDFFSLDSYFEGCGDWVFTAALHGVRGWRAAEFREAMTGRIDADRLELCLRLHDLVPDWISAYAKEIADTAGGLIGFTTTFQQNTASLALARELKLLDPASRIVFGGANCDGPQGAAWHRNFEFVDFVVRGEGELALPALVEHLDRGGDPARVPGLCWRDGSGEHVNELTTAPLPPAQIAAPDFDGYLERFAGCAAASETEPKLVVEGARGCWWGEKHHCTFCGLNGSSMQFRSKSPDRFHDELVGLAERYRVLDMYLVDNILDMEYLRTVLPRLEAAGYDLRLQCEIKANLRFDQLRQLVRAGVVQVQPGIENLSSRVLRLMDKGVDGCQNVRLLRDARSLGLTVMWNYLYGFPGELDSDYASVVGQLPALSHLPPMDGASRIALERFSPYFDDPAMGFAAREPDPQYFLNYDLPAGELRDLAYLFSTEPAGIGGRAEAELLAAVDAWAEHHPTSVLEHVELDDEVVVIDDRPGFGPDEHVLTGTDAELFRALDRPRSLPNLESGFGPRVRDRLDRWRHRGLLFTDDGRYVHVVPQANNQQLLRLG